MKERKYNFEINNITEQWLLVNFYLKLSLEIGSLQIPD